MDIPRFWARAKGDAETPDGAQRELIAWGWSTATLQQARDVAQERLLRLLSRVKQGDPLPMITRNVHGSVVLNTARLLFIDVDEPSGTLEALCSALRACAPTTFRIYRTAAGSRAMAFDREFAPETRRCGLLVSPRQFPREPRLEGPFPQWIECARSAGPGPRHQEALPGIAASGVGGR